MHERYRTASLTNAITQQASFEVLIYIHCLSLTPSALAQLPTDVLNETLLLGIGFSLRQVFRLRDEERQHAALFRIVFLSPDFADSIRMVRIQEQCVEHDTHQALVAPVLLHGLGNVLLDRLVGIRERIVHIDRKHHQDTPGRRTSRPATHFLTEAGEYADPFTLQYVAGHDSIKTTMRCVHPQADAVQRLFVRLAAIDRNELRLRKRKVSTVGAKSGAATTVPQELSG